MRIEVRRTIEQDFKAAGWRRCAEGQKETQHCALLEAAVKAEREACVANVLAYGGIHIYDASKIVDTIRERGQHG